MPRLRLNRGGTPLPRELRMSLQSVPLSLGAASSRLLLDINLATAIKEYSHYRNDVQSVMGLARIQVSV